MKIWTKMIIIYIKRKNKIDIKKCFSNILRINPKNQSNGFLFKKE